MRSIQSSSRLALIAGAALAATGSFATFAPADAAPVVLVPHRAVYELTLDASRNSRRVDTASGQIIYELKGNACEGYAVNLRQVTELDTGEGGSITSDLTTATWEDGDAKTYRFRISNSFNDQPKEDANGVAERQAGDKLAVTTKQPKTESFDLPGKVLLPSQHVINVLNAASAGDSTFEARVFDGSPDGRKVFDTLAVIGKQTTSTDGLEQAAKAKGLAETPRFPVTISYYEVGTQDTSPAYVMSFDLYANGVSRALKLDYGDFALRGTLTAFELLPPSGKCDK